MLPNLSGAGVHITLLSIVLLSHKMSAYFTDDQVKQGKSKVYVKMQVEWKWKRIQAK